MEVSSYRRSSYRESTGRYCMQINKFRYGVPFTSFTHRSIFAISNIRMLYQQNVRIIIEMRSVLLLLLFKKRKQSNEYTKVNGILMS